MGSYWPDLSRYVNNGRIYGAQLREGALWFSGDDHIYINNSKSLQITGDLTIFITVYPFDIDAVSRQGLVFKHYNYEYELIMNNDGSLTFYHGDGSWEEINSPSGMAMTEKVWNRIGIVRKMDDMAVHFYQNGQYMGAVSFTKTPVASSYPVTIGWRRGTSFYLLGFIGELLLFNTALTQEQMRILDELTSPYGTA